MRSPRQQKVVAAYPHPTQVSARFHKSWDALRQHDFGHLRRIAEGGGHLANSSGANVTNARNEIVEAFLDRHDADWLWFIDTDMVFEPDILDRLVEAAHPTERPVLGALCFSIQDGFRACPTLYTLREDGKAGRTYNYPRDTMLRTLTGSGCLLIHRSVLEGMRGKYPEAYPWFQETSTGGIPIGEDITFCIRAEAQGFPVHVDTSIKCGHEKTYVVSEDVYDAQKAAGMAETPTPDVPTFAVIASKSRRAMLTRLLDQLAPQVTETFVFDNGYDPPLEGAVAAAGLPLHVMWNKGLDLAAEAADGPHNVLIINDDVTVAPSLACLLGAVLRSAPNIGLTFPYEKLDEGTWSVALAPLLEVAGQTITGWCFMLRGEDGYRFDEQFEWWYGDSDIEKQVRRDGRHVLAVGAGAVHHDPMRSTLEDPERLAQARADEARFAEKWGIDPDTLWLAQNMAHADSCRASFEGSGAHGCDCKADAR